MTGPKVPEIHRIAQAFNTPMQVIGYIGTRASDPPEERGPLIRMNEKEARSRLLVDGELVWVHGPRRHELATLEIDETLPRGTVVVRDIGGLAVTEIVRVAKPDLDTPRDTRRLV